ncbi:hypothetical protein HYX12_00715 [Candidatus Woesearchaeota archaeon]|nr:hypothetical protein [Candidatus Woesearchaeota archaeon]
MADYSLRAGICLPPTEFRSRTVNEVQGILLSDGIQEEYHEPRFMGIDHLRDVVVEYAREPFHLVVLSQGSVASSPEASLTDGRKALEIKSGIPYFRDPRELSVYLRDHSLDNDHGFPWVYWHSEKAVPPERLADYGFKGQICTPGSSEYDVLRSLDVEWPGRDQERLMDPLEYRDLAQQIAILINHIDELCEGQQHRIRAVELAREHNLRRFPWMK